MFLIIRIYFTMSPVLRWRYVASNRSWQLLQTVNYPKTKGRKYRMHRLDSCSAIPFNQQSCSRAFFRVLKTWKISWRKGNNYSNKQKTVAWQNEGGSFCRTIITPTVTKWLQQLNWEIRNKNWNFERNYLVLTAKEWPNNCTCHFEYN